MQSSQKISVITPAYNVEKFIKECLGSVLSQSLKEIEVICIDDGSNDATLSILKSYQERDSRIILLEQENSGPSVARNKGLSIARGEYISFVDSDDYLEDGAFETCYNMAREYDADMVHFNARAVFESAEYEACFRDSYEEPIQKDFAKNDYARYGYEKCNSKESPPTGPGLFAIMHPEAYRTPIWLCLFKNVFIQDHQFRFIEGIYHADDDFLFKASLSSRSAAFCEKILYNRRFRPGSIMTTPIGRKNTISRIIGQEHMQSFLESIAADLPLEALSAAKEYLNTRKKAIADVYLKYLSNDGSDDEYKEKFNSLKDYDEPVYTPPPIMTRIKNRIKRSFF